MDVFGVVAQLGERVVRNDEVRGSIPLGSTILRRLLHLWVLHCFPPLALYKQTIGN